MKFDSGPLVLISISFININNNNNNNNNNNSNNNSNNNVTKVKANAKTASFRRLGSCGSTIIKNINDKLVFRLQASFSFSVEIFAENFLKPIPD